MPKKKNKAILLQEKLEHRILHGLACEWDAALWLLDSPYRQTMKKPLFSIRDMNNRLGYWSGEHHEICISRDLVLNHSWASVREVLIHEMAHQLSEKLFGNKLAPPHGPKFQEVCHLLRANPKASGSYPTLQDRLFKDSSETENKILLRIKKLMSLAESRNRHEAEAAMLKAHELIEKYNVDLLKREADRNFISVFAGSPALRHSRDKYHLANLLLDYYFVQGIWISAYVPEKEKMGRVLEISGTIPNVKYAIYVYDFVMWFIQSQWEKYNKDKGLNRYRLTDFATGIIEGFRSKLNSKPKTADTTKNANALVRIEDPLLSEYFKYKYPYTVNSTTKASSQDEFVLQDGKEIGKKLIISKGITTKKTGSQGLIGYRTSK